MNKRILRAFVAVGALATACASWGCVADRPSRNGVFNENQYVRKDFLVRPGTGGTDPGWFMKATLVSSSTPNVFFNLNPLFNGAESNVGGGTGGFVHYVRWVITSDKLELVSMREISGNVITPPAQLTRTPEIINAWPITNVDLKYEINLDGEITNFFQENQELDWQQRQWVKLQFDKNDMSDVAPLGEGLVAYLEQCGDANVSTTLVPGSFLVDETNNYMTWQVSITVPVNLVDQTCLASYGSILQDFVNFGRQDVTLNMLYSFVRAAPDSGIWDNTPAPTAAGQPGGRACTADLNCPATTYVPFVIGEKDPIQRKYGVLQAIAMDRDPVTQLMTGKSYAQRLNPNQKWLYTLYLSPGFPAQYEQIFCGYEPGKGLAGQPVTGAQCGAKGTGGLVDQTNAIWEQAGIDLRMRVMHNDDDQTFGDHASQNPKQFGDIRYHWIRFLTDIDSTPPGLLGVTEPLSDPRTGELISNTINITNTNIYDFYVNRLQFYLETISGNGADVGGVPGTNKNNPWVIGANGDFTYTPGGCDMQSLGDVMPVGGGTGPGGTDVTPNGAVQKNHNAISTVFAKMQGYLHKPLTTYGYLGPDDFIPQQTPDFFNAFFRLMPYQMFDDPSMNPYVIPEGGTGNYSPAQNMLSAISGRAQFNNFFSQVDRGVFNANTFDTQAVLNGGGVGTSWEPSSGQQGVQQLAAFSQQFKDMNKLFTESRWQLARVNPAAKMDTAESILGYFNNFEHAGRHCIFAPAKPGAAPTAHWESLTEWANDLTLSTWTYTIWHEFGHSLGLDHNFMGSVDRRNYPTWTDGHGVNQVGFYSSSIMEYPANAGDLFPVGGASQGDAANKVPAGKALANGAYNGRPGWMPYDVGALSFIYSNATTAKNAVPNGPSCQASGMPLSTCSVSGQINATAPWNDTAGFVGAQENQFLWCTDRHTRFSPFCQTFDFGTTPSEIIAHALDEEEWQYKWSNFRLYHKYWNDSGYAGGRANFYHDILRFLSSWAYDWSPGTLPELFVKLGITPPAGVPEQDYYAYLTNQFENDISVANQLAAAFQLGMVEQASGERPFITEFDPFFGDTIQQGIIIDKNDALFNYTTLYQVDNYDPTQAAGGYLFAGAPFDANYGSVAENVVDTLVGGQYSVFLYDVPLAVQNFVQTTQNPYFAGLGRAAMREWVGSTVFGGGITGNDPNQQLLSWAHALAAKWGAFGCTFENENDPSQCNWNPLQPQIDSNDIYHSDPYNEFRGPDNRRYAWAPIADRNQIMLVDRDWNTAAYVIVRNWNTDVTFGQDDGAGGNFAYQLELPMKYLLNSYLAYN